MLCFKIRNGLGNQLFQYAYAYYLWSRHNENIDIKFDYSELYDIISGRKTNDINEIFKYNFESMTVKEIRRITGRIFYQQSKGLFKKGSLIWRIFRFPKFNYNHTIVINEPAFWCVPDSFVESMKNMHIDSTKDYYFIGYWEDTKYITSIRKQLIQNVFDFKNIVVKKDILKAIMEKESVFVHIRRGDYLSDSEKSRPTVYYKICDDSYYRRAFDIINKRVDDPLFVFFSDDIGFIKKNFSYIENKLIMDGNTDYEDLYYMTKCKNGIIANSTFSFWGAFLNEREGLFIAPKYHYRYLSKNGIDYNKDFFRIDGWKYIDNINELI